MQLKGTQTAIAVIVIVVVLIGLGYLFLKHNSPPEPELGPGQTLQNPMGNVPSRGARPSAGPPAGAAGNAPATLPPGTPAPGTFNQQRGFGPSAGGPFRR